MPIDSSGTLRQLLAQVRTGRRQALESTVNGMRHLGFGMAGVITGITGRVPPEACYGAVFLASRKDCGQRINSTQGRWVARALGLEARVPRVLLLREFGFALWLAALVGARAAGVLASIDMALPSPPVPRA